MLDKSFVYKHTCNYILLYELHVHVYTFGRIMTKRCIWIAHRTKIMLLVWCVVDRHHQRVKRLVLLRRVRHYPKGPAPAIRSTTTWHRDLTPWRCLIMTLSTVMSSRSRSLCASYFRIYYPVAQYHHWLAFIHVY